MRTNPPIVLSLTHLLQQVANLEVILEKGFCKCKFRNTALEVKSLTRSKREKAKSHRDYRSKQKNSTHPCLTDFVQLPGLKLSIIMLRIWSALVSSKSTLSRAMETTRSAVSGCFLRSRTFTNYQAMYVSCSYDAQFK